MKTSIHKIDSLLEEFQKIRQKYFLPPTARRASNEGSILDGAEELLETIVDLVRNEEEDRTPAKQLFFSPSPPRAKSTPHTGVKTPLIQRHDTGTQFTLTPAGKQQVFTSPYSGLSVAQIVEGLEGIGNEFREGSPEKRVIKEIQTIITSLQATDKELELQERTQQLEEEKRRLEDELAKARSATHAPVVSPGFFPHSTPPAAKGVHRDAQTISNIVSRFNEKDLFMTDQKRIIVTVKEKKADFILADYTVNNGVETWTWHDPTPGRKGNPEYNITYTRDSNGSLQISYGKRASAYVCIEPDEKTGRHGTIVDIETGSMTIYSPNEDKQVIVPKHQVLGQMKGQESMTAEKAFGQTVVSRPCLVR